MDLGTIKLVLDIILIVIAVWMVQTTRGLGGIVGSTLSYITWGAIVTGVAHLLATWDGQFGWSTNLFGPDTSGITHRAVVLVGFVLLVIGFRKLEELK